MSNSKLDSNLINNVITGILVATKIAESLHIIGHRTKE